MAFLELLWDTRQLKLIKFWPECMSSRQRDPWRSINRWKCLRCRKIRREKIEANGWKLTPKEEKGRREYYSWADGRFVESGAEVRNLSHFNDKDMALKEIILSLRAEQTSLWDGKFDNFHTSEYRAHSRNDIYSVIIMTQENMRTLGVLI